MSWEDKESESEYSSESYWESQHQRRTRASKLQAQKKEDSEEWIEEETIKRSKRQQQVHKKYKYMDSDEQDSQSEHQPDEEECSIFFPQIEQILWRKWVDHKYQYLVKYKGYSYLHLDWLDEPDIATNKQGKNRLVRFKKVFEQKIKEMDEDEMEDEENYYDMSYTEVDRLVYCADMFPVLHPKKALEMKSKWSESTLKVVQLLLNYTRNDVRYGIVFMEPVNPQRDGCYNYKRVISQPMDLGTIANKIYLDCYRGFPEIWYDVGLVFKNCRKFNVDSKEEIRIIGDTLREVAIYLYQQWYSRQYKKYRQLLQIYQNNRNDVNSKQNNQQDCNQELEMFDSQEIMELESMLVKVNEQTQKEYDSRIQEQKIALDRFEDYFRNEEVERLEVKEVLENYMQKVGMDQIDYDIIKKRFRDIYVVNQKQNISIPQSEEQIEQFYEDRFKGYQVPYNKELIKQVEQELNYQNVQDKQQIDIKQFENELQLDQIEKYNPGEFSYEWIKDSRDEENEDIEENYYLEEEDKQEVDIDQEVDMLYQVKWRNLSYIQVNWEPYSLLNCPDKLQQFKQQNKALDKENRSNILNQVQRHKTLIDLMNNPRKKQRMGQSVYNEILNRMYCYDISNYKRPIQYSVNNQPIYKDRKLLRSYQLESLNWLIVQYYQRKNVILADEMGLGKTIQTTAFLNHLYSFEPAKGPFLVIAPLSTLEHWKRTVNEWTNLNGILYYDLNGAEGRNTCRAYEWYHTDISTKGMVIHTNQVYKFNVLITSYEVFLQDFNNVFIDIPFQMIVIDEAHRLKNQNAKILNSLRRLPCKRILLLTGTPIQNNTEELWSLLNFIEPNQFNSLSQFQNQFGDLNNVEQIQNLHKVLQPYLLRRMKEDVESSIPPLQETIIDVEMTTVQKTIYRTLYDRNKSVLTRQVQISNSSFDKIMNTSLNNLEMQLRKCCNHPFLIKEIEQNLNMNIESHQERFEKIIESSGKMMLLDKLLTKLIREGKKVLIFSQFTKMLDLLEEYLQYKQYKFEKIDGSVKSKERQNSIDRFNNPEKKKDVFLLSTKAGGLGINLTSANVVIIFDSDWNPQNDVQATARAHRIGQKQEVLAYRLITRNTYEAEMFERATKKLGLDQAIFMGGDYQNKNQSISTSKNQKLSNNEIELLLKKGILGLFDKGIQKTDDQFNIDENQIKKQFEQQQQDYFDENIDNILAKNTRIAKYSLINSNFTIAKSSFVSKNCDTSLNINDPQFWEQVLKQQESESKKYLHKLQDQNQMNEYKNIEKQKELLKWTSDNVNRLIQSKLNVEQFNVDEENNIILILQIIMNSPNIFYRQYRDVVGQWMDEIERPSRRFKMINVDQIDLKNQRVINYKQYEEDEEVSEEDKYMNVDNNKLLSNKEKEERLRKLCAYCERSRCLMVCDGFCKRSFHMHCKQLVIEKEQVCGLDSNPIDFQLNEKQQNDEKLKKQIIANWLCKDCEQLKGYCFICKKKGSLNINESFSYSSNKLHKCQLNNCYKYYHPSCIQQQNNNDKNTFKCGLHVCKKCGQQGESKFMVQCFRCPTAYHNQCLNASNIVKLSKKFILCEKHIKVKENKKKSVKQALTREKNQSLIIKFQLQDQESISSQILLEKKQNGIKKKQENSRSQKISYNELGIPTPDQFEYETYDKDWCRYCGARFSSNFTKGPWAPRTLCTIHYIEWSQKKKLNLDQYKQIPKRPIDLKQNNELDYIIKTRQKNPEYDPLIILNEQPRIKKVKTEK